MNLNRSSFSLLRQFNPATAAGRDALQQLTQKDVDAVRERFRDLPILVSKWAWFLTQITNLYLICMAGLLTVGVVARLWHFMFLPEPFNRDWDAFNDSILSFNSEPMWATIAVALLVNLICRPIVVRTDLVNSFKPMEEHWNVEWALRVANQHPEAIAYQKEVASLREFIRADADALIKFAEESKPNQARAKQKKINDRQERLQ